MAQEKNVAYESSDLGRAPSPWDAELNTNVNSWKDGIPCAAPFDCSNNMTCYPRCEPGCLDTKGSGFGNMTSEMRNLATNIDCEIQRLRCDLKQRDADDRTYSNLREELKLLMEKVESGMSHNKELESQLYTAGCEKKSLMCDLEEALGCLEDRDRSMNCIETRLNERSAQNTCLQEDLENKGVVICHLEQHIRTLESQLNDCLSNKEESPAYKDALARIKELEAIILIKNKSLEEVKEDLSVSLNEMRILRIESSKQISCLNLELGVTEKKIIDLKDDLEAMRQKHHVIQTINGELQRTNRAKDDKLICFEEELEEVKFTKKKMEDMLTNQLEACKDAFNESQLKCSELEKSLALCHKEVSDHLHKMEQIRNKFDCELEQRDNCIRKLKDDLRQTVEELKCKTEDNNYLENSITESRNKLQEMCNQLSDSEGRIQCLTANIQEMDKLMLKEKSSWMKEAEDLERRLVQACQSLSIGGKEIEALRCTLQDKKDENDTLSSEKRHVCQEVKKCEDMNRSLGDQIKKMEQDNQDLCRQLQQKMVCIRDIEAVVRGKEQELKCLAKMLHDINNDSSSNQSLRSRLEGDISKYKEQLKKCHEESKNRALMLTKCEEEANRWQLVAEDKDREIEALKCQIKLLNDKVFDRNERIDELEAAIESIQKDVDRRMSRVDEQLKKYETELSDKMYEIGDLNECIRTCQLNISEKMEESAQQDKRICLLTSELNSVKQKTKELEDSRDHLNVQLLEKKTEVADLTNQERMTKEQMQKQHEDLSQCRQSLSCANRDADTLRRELDDAVACVSQRDCEIGRLNVERKGMMDRMAQLTVQTEQEICMLQQQMCEMKTRLEKEVDCLRGYTCQLESTNSTNLQKMSIMQRHLMQVEKCFNQKIDSLNRDIGDLTIKLKCRDDEILSLKDCISVKDSEIGRLKIRLCNNDTACGKDMCKQ